MVPTGGSQSAQQQCPGSGPLSSLTVASMGSRFWPEARYQSWSTRSCSWAKKLMAGIERKATSMALGLHCLCMRVASSSFLFLDEPGVIARTSPKRI